LQSAYVNPEAGTMVEARRFLGRTFRVTREQPSLEWQLTSEQAEHLGYMVLKATAQKDSATTIDAWFTPQIPVQGGPESYGGLPGMILVLSVNDGQVQYQATEVALGELEEGTIRPPDEGDEMSQEEFEQLVKERLEEMTRNRRPPGGDEWR
jgi:GLPGLI family protein